MMYRMLLLMALFVNSPVFSASTVCPEGQCIAVVNAGNSGSRLHIYSYQMDVSHTPVEIKNVFSNRIEPGFGSLELSQRAINEHLSLLFSDISDRDIPVYFYATSGMRMKSFSRQQAYYAKLNAWFAKQSQWQLAVSKTLTSQEEALYGWLAVNYELGTLTSASEPLVGVVDSGSASVQVAFPLKNKQAMHSDDVMDITVYGRQVSLFTHGFLGLGQDEIRSQYLDSSVCFPTHYPLPNGSSGAGDFQQCEQLIKPLINDIHQVDTTVQSVIQNNPDQTWYIIGGISKMVQERPFKFENNTFTNQVFSEKANRQVCQQDWSILGTLYPENQHLFTSCLNASYFYALFVDGLGIDSTQPIHYISNKISTNDWPLGVVLYPEGMASKR